MSRVQHPPTISGAETLLASLTLSGTYQDSLVVDVSEARTIVVLAKISYNGAGNIVDMLPFLAAKGTAPPVSTDDVWYSPMAYDGTVSAQVLTETLHANVDYSQAPEWGAASIYPLQLIGPTADNATDEQRIAIPIKCEWAHWFHLQVADQDSAGFATFAADYVLVS